MALPAVVENDGVSKLFATIKLWWRLHRSRFTYLLSKPKKAAPPLRQCRYKSCTINLLHYKLARLCITSRYHLVQVQPCRIALHIKLSHSTGIDHLLIKYPAGYVHQLYGNIT